MYKKLTNDVSITIHKDCIYLHLKKHTSVVINAEDKYRKGIEIDICSNCGDVCKIVMCDDNKRYCEECAENLIKKDE